MSEHRIFPQPISEFNNYVDTVTPFLNANAARLVISAGYITTLNTLFDQPGVTPPNLGWKQLWVIYSDESTVTKAIREIIKTRRGQLELHLRKIYNDIPASTLTETDRLTLHLPQRDTNPTPVQPVDFAPVISFDAFKNSMHVLRFQNPETPDSNAMPKGQKIELHYYVGAAGLPDNDVPFTLWGDNGKHLLRIQYQPNQKGLTAYYRARYKTSTGKVAIFSDVVSEIIN